MDSRGNMMVNCIPQRRREVEEGEKARVIIKCPYNQTNRKLTSMAPIIGHDSIFEGGLGCDYISILRVSALLGIHSIKAI